MMRLVTRGSRPAAAATVLLDLRLDLLFGLLDEGFAVLGVLPEGPGATLVDGVPVAASAAPRGRSLLMATEALEDAVPDRLVADPEPVLAEVDVDVGQL